MAHPYDDAWSVIKSMQAEIADLKVDLNTEKARRAQEVGELQREVRTLRGQLEQALRDLNAANERVSCALTSETALRGRALEMLRKEVADAIQLSQEVHHLKTIQATHFGKLTTELKTEKSERVATQQTFDAMLSAEVQTRTEEGQMLAQRLDHQKRVAEENLQMDREAFNALVQDVHAAGDLLNVNLKEAGRRFGIQDFAESSPGGSLSATAAVAAGQSGSLIASGPVGRPATFGSY